MVGMIRQILTLLEEGDMTFSEVAGRMGLSEPELRNRLEMMTSMGHLESVPIQGDTLDPSADCPGCAFSSSCVEDSCSDGVPVVGYRVTDKGRRLARKTMARGLGPSGGDDDEVRT